MRRGSADSIKARREMSTATRPDIKLQPICSPQHEITWQTGGVHINIMKLFLRSLALSAGFLLSAHGFAQTPTATAPVKPPASASAPAATNSTTVANPMETKTTGTPPATAKKDAKSTYKTPATAAAGGGDGKVWVNSASKVYHCPGTKYYGKTKAGEYMTEADAKAKGNHANNKKACS